MLVKSRDWFNFPMLDGSIAINNRTSMARGVSEGIEFAGFGFGDHMLLAPTYAVVLLVSAIVNTLLLMCVGLLFSPSHLDNVRWA